MLRSIVNLLQFVPKETFRRYHRDKLQKLCRTKVAKKLKNRERLSDGGVVSALSLDGVKFRAINYAEDTVTDKSWCLFILKMFNGKNFVLITLWLALGKSCCSSEVEVIKVVNNEDHPIRKEFNNHTETCFKHFKSSMVKLAVVFLDPASETNDDQQESKCWVKCMLEHFHFIKMTEGEATGEIVPAKIMERTEELSQETRSRLGQVLDKCENKVRGVEDLCNKAFAFARCVFEMYRRKELIPLVPVIPVRRPVVVAG